MRFLGHSLSSFLGNESFLGLGFGLRFGTHNTTTPLLPVFIVLVVEVGLNNSKKREIRFKLNLIIY
jgi:hypothetical protein